ncbi:MAG: helix-turn-helix domain-containing protein [Ruminococcaceae bacterium]|nr:helix-turn-helix domain-containing protein [Oscillospiraceae bacterium]
MNKIKIGEYILNYRKQQDLTQGQFGDLLGVSAVSVSKWERELCYPDIFLLPDISNLIGISIDEMMGNTHSLS